MTSLLQHSLTLWAEGLHEAAVGTARRALDADPSSSAIALVLANMLRDVGDWHGAERVLAAAIAVDPASPALRNQICQIRLTLGKWREAWPDLLRGAAARHGAQWPAPNWRGEPVPGGTVLLYADGGLGDAIMWVRYVERVSHLARLLILGPPTLGRLFATLPGLAGYVGELPVPAYDRHLPLSYLPVLFGTEPSSVPAAVPYLHAEDDLVDVWRKRLQRLPGRRVGLVWSGNPDYQGSRDRSVPLPQLAPLLRVSGNSFIALQMGPAAADAAAFPEIWNAMDGVREMADTAALISALDLTITVDTAVVHLAGALGKPVWLLNRFNTDWRWLLQREDSVWYPTLRQFRQKALGDWSGPIAEAAAALADHRVSGPQSSGHR